MKVVLALAVMLSINMFLFLGQVSVESIAQSEYGTPSGSQFFNYGDSQIGDYNTGTEANPVGNTNLTLPEAEQSIAPDTGNFFLDPIASLKKWFSTSKIGIGWDYFSGIINAVPNFLNNIFTGELSTLAFALGFFWNGLTLFLVIMLIWGRQL